MRIKQRFRYIGGCLGVIGIYALATLPVLLNFPAVWPDEVNLYSPAAALARGEGMGTSVLAGFLPGIERYTYWQPPGYFFFLSLVLRFVSPAHHFLADRLFSWSLGIVVLVLGAAILKRLTTNAGWALLGLVVLATEVSFIEVANVGRMEMLALACTMAALNCYLAYRQTSRLHVLALTSFLAGLAMVCHPVGILSALLIVVHELAAPRRRGNRVNEVLVFLGCMLAAFLPWFLYIAQAPHIFRAQMTAQSLRKSLYVGSVIGSRGYTDWLMFPFVSATWPEGHYLAGLWPFAFGSGVIVPLLMFGAGLAAILAEGRRQLEASLLGAWVLAGYGINLLLSEFWYAAHFVAPCCLLLGWAAAESSRKWVRAAAIATLIVAAFWNVQEIKILWWANRGGEMRYTVYGATIADRLPAKSTVLLAAIPDPYFYLIRHDKSFRIFEFVPEGVPVDAEARGALSKVDYVVGSNCCRPDYLVDFLTSRGRVEAILGSRDFLSPPVFIWKISRGPESSPLKMQKPHR